MNKAFSKSQSIGKNLFKFQKKDLNKTFRPTKYNLRLYYSNLGRNPQSYGRWDDVWGPNGGEATQTDRNPNNFMYKTNLWNQTAHEARHIYGDVIYQIIRRRHRLGDKFMKYVLPTTTIGLYLLSGNHICFFVSIYF